MNNKKVTTSLCRFTPAVKTEAVGVRMTPQMRKALTKVAAQEDTSEAVVIRRALKLFLRQRLTRYN
ncbi:MAG: hypothetical protein GY750_18805 [Lentisphaerae bacterium]|nr:hypothetical protein [Lentisphaerota bacterium]